MTFAAQSFCAGNLSDETCAAIYKELTEVHQIQLFDTAEGYGGGTSEERLRDVKGGECGDEKRKGFRNVMRSGGKADEQGC